MYFLEVVLIGISLAMDAFAICLCRGLASKNKGSLALKLGLTFGAFQAIMPWLGYSVGNIFSSKVSIYGNILAFIILVLIGINMIKEGKEEEEKCDIEIGLKALLGMGIATSIDALAVGLSFAMNGQQHIYLSVMIIGIVTFIISVVGTNLGSKVGELLGSKAHYFGGTVLIILGVKALIG